MEYTKRQLLACVYSERPTFTVEGEEISPTDIVKVEISGTIYAVHHRTVQVCEVPSFKEYAVFEAYVIKDGKEFLLDHLILGGLDVYVCLRHVYQELRWIEPEDNYEKEYLAKDDR